MKKLLAALLLIVLTAIAWLYLAQPEPLLDQEPENLKIPLGLIPVPWPDDNPYSKRKAELGRLLYFDKRLSTDGTIACSSCHSVPRAFTDHRKIAIGIHGRVGSRHTPTVINAAYEKLLFWDGRANSLEEQTKGPIGNPNEMTLIDDVHKAHLQCEAKVKGIPGYRSLFKEVFGNDRCSLDDIAQAIATFERTVLSGNSAFDRYVAGDRSAMTSEQIDGYKLFKHLACDNCHNGPNLTDGRFQNIGIGMDAEHPDLGRYEITKNEKDKGAFKVPTLREVSKTYPYMHDGSLATLEDVIEYYNKGGIPNPNLHPLMKPLGLSAQQKKALVSFLQALEGEGWQHFSAPTAFP